MEHAKALDVFAEDPNVGGLAGWTYDNDEMTELEKEMIFRRNWLIAGHVSEIPEPGNFLTFDVADERALVIRGKDGVVRAFHNLCRHRGSRVVDSDYGTCKHAIVCPFHGWSYNLTGELRGVPMPHTFPGLDKRQMGLKPVDMEIWQGFIYIRFKPGDGPSVAETMAEVNDEASMYKMADMVPLSERYRIEFDINWKATVDVDNEGYHVPIAHPSLDDLYGETYRDETLANGVSRAYGTFGKGDHKLWSVRHYDRILPKVDHLPESHQKTWLYLGNFPTNNYTVYPDSVSFYQFLPISTRRVAMVGRTFGLPDDRREMKLARYLAQRIDKFTIDEDIQLTKWSWEGMRSSAYEDFFLSSIEAGVRSFHDQMRAALPVMSLPEAPAPGTVAEVNAEMASRS